METMEFLEDLHGNEIPDGDWMVCECNGPIQRHDPGEPPYPLQVRICRKAEFRGGIAGFRGLTYEWVEIETDTEFTLYQVSAEFHPWEGVRFFRDSYSSEDMDKYDPNPVKMFTLSAEEDWRIRNLPEEVQPQGMWIGSRKYISGMDYTFLREEAGRNPEVCAEIEALLSVMRPEE